MSAPPAGFMDLDNIPDEEFAGLSIEIEDPGEYRRLHKGDFGYIFRAANFKSKRKPPFADRYFQLHIDNYPGAVVLPGRSFQITEKEAGGEALVGKYLEMLRHPMRKELKDRNL